MSGTVERQHIVVGIDAHAANDRAVDWVVAAARSYPCDIELITAMDSMVSDPVAAEERLARVRRRLAGGAGSTVRSELRFGDAATVLVDAARHAQLLVIGSRRDHPIRTALDGWLPERIPTRSTVPTVVVPSDWSGGSGDVVHGVDDDIAVAALDAAARTALRLGRGLVLVRVWRAPSADDEGMLAALGDPARHEDHGRRILDDAARIVSGRFPTLHTRPLLLEGVPGRVLASIAVSATLVVIGRNHRTTLGGALGGSVAHRLIQDSRTPVCVVPGTTADERAQMSEADALERSAP
ncbi:universal stress protein [Curtobacterium sp. VKM Ac-1393]|uniref:universal stress protein n=1 Tax=Curtobacterium sp. VKM Ac-1393 TaxID=2783814 RepID=UPI00188B778D|nr:universal stress protein [Curtobacterium sp. VKM Ac-1393]MBF4606894.1 universal stress protein [Curtobacterium sp. VKM Ac-1393]